MDYLIGLNERQREAVLHTEGPLLIVAGAGAGKTRVITQRIFHLIKKGVSPRSILAITFTNKAAKEMRDRVAKLLNQQPITDNLQQGGPSSVVGRRSWNVDGSPFISTFHSLGVQIIRENSTRLGIPQHFAIFDRGDSIGAIKEALRRVDLDPKDFEPGKILSVISREKGKMSRLDEFRERSEKEYFPALVARVWGAYEKILKEEKALDFDDLLLKTAFLLQKEDGVREHYQKLWQYIHIDEYQDTNHVQYMIAKLLADAHKNIAVVGDMDQCLLPDTLIRTPSGEKPISTIKEGDKVTTSAGMGEVCTSSVSKTYERPFHGKILEIKLSNGSVLRSTPKHMLFSRLSVVADIWYVYLMYRKDKGFRVGLVKGVRHARD